MGGLPPTPKGDPSAKAKLRLTAQRLPYAWYTWNLGAVKQGPRLRAYY